MKTTGGQGWIKRMGASACLVLLLAACQYIPVMTPSPSEDIWILRLYPADAFDAYVNEEGAQPGLAGADLSTPLDTVTAADLVAVNWPQRDLTLSAAAHARWLALERDDITRLVFAKFTVEYQGALLFGGTLTPSITEIGYEYPVLVVDPVEESPEGSLRLQILPKLRFRPTEDWTLPGISPDLDHKIDADLKWLVETHDH